LSAPGKSSHNDVQVIPPPAQQTAGTSGTETVKASREEMRAKRLAAIEGVSLSSVLASLIMPTALQAKKSAS
jgi:hypothetical protein